MTEFLVCAPAYYDVKYEINDWMKLSNRPDPIMAKRQWSYLHDRLIESGATLKYMPPQPEFPDMVFTANAGVVMGKRVVLSNFKNEERRGEKQYFKKWFLENGYQVIEIPENIFFEGAGDALFVGDTLFMGYGFRTSIESHSIVAKALGVNYISCELVDPKFYHLDTCFLPYDGGVLYYLDAFSTQSQEDILSNLIGYTISHGGMTISPSSHAQAHDFMCNSVMSNDSIITPSKRFEETFLGYNVYRCEMSEFIKSGGAAKCLTLKL